MNYRSLKSLVAIFCFVTASTLTLLIPAQAKPDCDANPDAPICSGEPRPRPKPAPFVSSPDYSLQLATCIPDFVRPLVTEKLRQTYPGADVRLNCLNSHEQIGIWMIPMAGVDTSAARERGLSSISLLRSGDTFAALINANAIRRQVNEQWNQQPKRLNSKGQPASDGSIQLNALNLNFLSPNQVVSTVTGVGKTPWLLPDVNFSYISTDTLFPSQGRIQCTSASKLEKDTRRFWLLGSIFTFVFPPLGAFYFVSGAIVSAVNGPSTTATSVGCNAAKILPAEISIEPNLKFQFNYQRLEVTPRGINTGGTFSIVQ